MTTHLTRRQKQITHLIWLGLSNVGIAQHLGLSESTVRQHVAKVYKAHNIPFDPLKSQRVILVARICHERRAKETP